MKVNVLIITKLKETVGVRSMVESITFKRKHMNLQKDKVIIQSYVHTLELLIRENHTIGEIANRKHISNTSSTVVRMKVCLDF